MYHQITDLRCVCFVLWSLHLLTDWLTAGMALIGENGVQDGAETDVDCGMLTVTCAVDE